MQAKTVPFFFLTLGITLITLLSIFSSSENQDKLVDILGLNETTEYIQPNNQINSKAEIVKIERVVDGDTAVLDDGRKIRYLNIDTPESVKPNTPVQCYAKEASAINKALVDQKTVILKYDENKTDRYGRDLAFIFLENKNSNDITQSVNAYLVRTGYARASIYPDNDTYKDEFYKMEREAKEKNLGLWKACPNPFVE